MSEFLLTIIKKFVGLVRLPLIILEHNFENSKKNLSKLLAGQVKSEENFIPFEQILKFFSENHQIFDIFMSLLWHKI